MSEMPPSSYTPPPPPPPSGGTGSGSSDRGIMIFLSYFGLFALIPMLTKKDDPDIQWHSKNGLALAIAYIPIWVVIFILQIALPGVLRWIMLPINCGFPIIWLIVDIMAMVKAFGGQRMRIPIVTDMAEKMFGA